MLILKWKLLTRYILGGKPIVRKEIILFNHTPTSLTQLKGEGIIVAKK